MFGGGGGGGLFGSVAAPGQGFGGVGGQGANPNQSKSGDINLGTCPDSISSVCAGHWASPNGPVGVVASGCWDGNAYVWIVGNAQAGQQPAVQGPVTVSHDGCPVLDVCCTPNGQIIITGSVDGTAKMFDCATSATNIVARHVVNDKPQPIRFVRAYAQPDGQQILATASWDMTVKFWSLSNPTGTPIGEYGAADIGERVYAFDIVYPRCVIGTALNQIHIYDLQTHRKVDQIPSPLSHQMRTISVFPDGMGFAVGSVEGRVGIQYFSEKNKNFAFRCHREQPQGRPSESLVYPVNNISFNRKYNTFATAGSDGIFNFWDKDTKQCLKKFEKASQTISAAAFQYTNDAHTMPMFVYAISYDWHKGPESYRQDEPNTVWIHCSQDAEIKPKAKR